MNQEYALVKTNKFTATAAKASFIFYFKIYPFDTTKVHVCMQYYRGTRSVF